MCEEKGKLGFPLPQLTSGSLEDRDSRQVSVRCDTGRWAKNDEFWGFWFHPEGTANSEVRGTREHGGFRNFEGVSVAGVKVCEGDAKSGAFRGPRSPNPWHLKGGTGMFPVGDGKSAEHLHRSHVVRLHLGHSDISVEGDSVVGAQGQRQETVSGTQVRIQWRINVRISGG